MDPMHGYRNPIPFSQAFPLRQDAKKPNTPPPPKNPAPVSGPEFVNLVITPYERHELPLEFPAELVGLLKEIVAVHSIPGTHYQSRFYVDANDDFRFYHVWTSPWNEEDMRRIPAPCEQSQVTRYGDTEASSDPNQAPAPKMSMATYTSRISLYADVQSSNGRIKLGMHRVFTSNISDAVLAMLPAPPPAMTRVPLDAACLVIGTRIVPAVPSRAGARSRFFELSAAPLTQLATHTGAGQLAAGWVENMYSPFSPDMVEAYSASEQRRVDDAEGERAWESIEEFESWEPRAAEVPRETFKTLTGWQKLKDYEKFARMMTRNWERGAVYGRSGTRGVLFNPGVVGEEVLYLKKIA